MAAGAFSSGHKKGRAAHLLSQQFSKCVKCSSSAFGTLGLEIETISAPPIRIAKIQSTECVIHYIRSFLLLRIMELDTENVTSCLSFYCNSCGSQARNEIQEHGSDGSGTTGSSDHDCHGLDRVRFRIATDKLSHSNGEAHLNGKRMLPLRLNL